MGTKEIPFNDDILELYEDEYAAVEAYVIQKYREELADQIMDRHPEIPNIHFLREKLLIGFANYFQTDLSVMEAFDKSLRKYADIICVEIVLKNEKTVTAEMPKNMYLDIYTHCYRGYIDCCGEKIDVKDVKSINILKKCA